MHGQRRPTQGGPSKRVPTKGIRTVEETQNNLRDLQTFVEEGVLSARDNKIELNDLLKYVIGIVVPQLKKVMKPICHDIDQHHKLDITDDQEPNFVHYTSIGTLLSMLECAAKKQVSSLRLYDSVHLNDPGEGSWLVSYLAQKHGWVAQSFGYSSHAYITSFVAPSPDCGKAMRDELMFWQVYGREGEGCSLSVSVPNSGIRKVVYGACDAEFAVETLLPILDILEPIANASQEVSKALARAFRESLEGIQYLYKGEAYRHENECRFIMHKSETCESNICFEQMEDSPLNIRHYCENEDLRIEKLLISGSKITIGPCVPNQEDLRQVLEILKKRAELLGPTICLSQIPYRKF